MTAFYLNGDRDFVTHINCCNVRAEDVKCNYGHIAAYQIVKISLVFEAVRLKLQLKCQFYICL